MSRKESPMLSVWDGDKLIGLEICCPNATSPQPDLLELELVRIFNEHKQLRAELIEAKEEIEGLRRLLEIRCQAYCSLDVTDKAIEAECLELEQILGIGR